MDQNNLRARGHRKTHLARAYARGCRGRGARSYHVKAREPRDRLAGPAGPGGGGSVTGTLARADCFAVDEIGRRASGRERAGPPLRVVERRCEREGPTLPRVLDDATLFVARGPGLRGASPRTYAAGTAPVAAKTHPTGHPAGWAGRIRTRKLTIPAYWRFSPDSTEG